MNDEGLARIAFEAHGGAFADWPNLATPAMAAWLNVGRVFGDMLRAAAALEIPGENDPGEPEPRYALVEQMGYRRVYGTVAEVTFCERPMLEVTSLETGATQLLSPESLYALTWLTKEQAERATRTGAHAIAAIGSGRVRPDGWPDDDLDDGDEDETAAVLADPETMAAIAEGEEG